MAALLPLAALVVAFLLSQPRLTLAALLGVVIVVEADPVGLLPIGPSFYSPIRAGQTPPDLLFYILVAGTGLNLMRERSHPRGIGPMTLPIIALAAAAIGGLATGYYAGASPSGLVASGLRFGQLLLLPFLVANLLTDEASVRGFLVGAAGLAAFKAVTGLLAVATRRRLHRRRRGHHLLRAGGELADADVPAVRARGAHAALPAARAGSGGRCRSRCSPSCCRTGARSGSRRRSPWWSCW